MLICATRSFIVAFSIIHYIIIQTLLYQTRDLLFFVHDAIDKLHLNDYPITVYKKGSVDYERSTGKCENRNLINMHKERQNEEKEALKSVASAIQMNMRGKYMKAMKLFEHAMALGGKHPDILTYYGEFLEMHQNDIVNADHYYYKALTLAPKHPKALINRRRTIRIVDNLDNGKLKKIERKRDQLIAIPETNPTFQYIKQEGYFLHIYHTVALEGNTMSFQDARFLLKTRRAIVGNSINEHNEFIGVDLAFQYVNSILDKCHSYFTFTIETILELHKRIMGPVDPGESGNFRNTVVFVGGHYPAAPETIPKLMEEFVKWLNSKSALKLHSISYAALAHYRLVYIHPFKDGNGRTSRLIMNLILMQAGYPPIIIPKQFRQKYFDTLKIANEGDERPFIRFIAICTELTLDFYIRSIFESNKTDILRGNYYNTSGYALKNKFEIEFLGTNLIDYNL